MVHIHSASFAYNYEQNLNSQVQFLKRFKLYTCTIKLTENEYEISGGILYIY